MSEPYRNEVDTLEARKVALESELASVNHRLEAKRRLPTLDDVRIATPCKVGWDEMKGDGRVRFCGQCEKNVFNVANMSRAEAEGLIHERMQGSEVCVRLFRRVDGTILTSDCPVGIRAKMRWRMERAIVAGGILAILAAFAAKYVASKTCNVSQAAAGGMAELK